MVIAINRGKNVDETASAFDPPNREQVGWMSAQIEEGQPGQERQRTDAPTGCGTLRKIIQTMLT